MKYPRASASAATENWWFRLNAVERLASGSSTRLNAGLDTVMRRSSIPSSTSREHHARTRSMSCDSWPRKRGDVECHDFTPNRASLRSVRLDPDGSPLDTEYRFFGVCDELPAVTGANTVYPGGHVVRRPGGPKFESAHGALKERRKNSSVRTP
jgi:hypothetical protein